MKKWLIAVVVASLGVGVGCETPDSQQAEANEAKSEASAPEAQSEQDQSQQDQSQQDQAEQAQAQPEQAEPGAKDKEKAELPEDLADGTSGTYGGEFSVEGEPLTLAAAMEKAADSQGPFKVSADIAKVCKKKGCWFTLSAEGVEQPVRVRMKDYSFFVPRNADGAQAVVEGELKKRVIPKKEAQHYADDEVAGTDQEPKKIEKDEVKWEMTITAAKITKS